MSDAQPIASRRWNWLKIALVASLALNVLIGAAIATRYARGPDGGRFAMPGNAQLVPRAFLSELTRERRREITQVLNRYRRELRGERDAARGLTLKIADALSAEPYSPEAVKVAVAEFSAQGAKLSSGGGDAALEILGMLTPDERKQLANAMRERASKR
jgi:Spy/CpxP family protein refolding chaperone